MIVEEKNVRFEEDKPRRGWFFRRSNRRSPKTPEAEQNVSILSDQYNKFNKTAEDNPELQTRTMVVHPRAKSKHEFRSKKEYVLDRPPPAREAAFGGPVRYDWIDIVSRP